MYVDIHAAVDAQREAMNLGTERSSPLFGAYLAMPREPVASQCINSVAVRSPLVRMRRLLKVWLRVYIEHQGTHRTYI